MKLIQVHGPAFRIAGVFCTGGCGTEVDFNPERILKGWSPAWWADTDGEPFKAYLCEPCKIACMVERNGYTPEAARYELGTRLP